VLFLDAQAFAFEKSIPPALTHTFYCTPCYDSNVAPVLEIYQSTLEQAKSVFIFFKTQRSGIPLIKKAKDSFLIKDCMDRDETIMRLAFFAAQRGYNAVVDTEAVSRKNRNGSYQNSIWTGSGTAAQIDAAKMELLDSQERKYRS
jgi:hypothetical protein